MLLSNTETGEYDVIRKSEHIERVWAEIEASLPRYWQAFIAAEAETHPGTQLAARFSTSGSKTASDAVVAGRTFAAAIEKYEKEATKYRSFFEEEAMEEFGDDPNAFKTHLAKEVPVIAGTLNQRRKELQEWQRHFREARGPNLYHVFMNILDFRSDWIRTKPEEVYSALDDPASFELDPLDADEHLGLRSVIGMGIKSIVLYHLDPRVFPQRGRFDLYGLYFLSNKNDFDLASRSSEFLMINDREKTESGSYIMEHNFWYPYGLFSLYAIRLFRWLEHRMREDGRPGLDTQLRYVYVTRFLDSVCNAHREDMKVMRVHDRFGIPA